MAMKAAKRFSVKTDESFFKRVGRGNQENMTRNHHVKTAVCKYWLKGRCTRSPCRFLHPDSPAKPDTSMSKYAWKNPNSYKSENSPPIEKSHQRVSKNKENCDHNQIVSGTQQKALINEVNARQSQSIENCIEGPKCENLQSWFCDNGLSMVAQFEGHTKAITGIVFPCGTNKLYCASKDKSFRVWDCNSRQCVDVFRFDDECGTLVKEGPWIFAGLRDMIKAWNLETQNEIDIQGSCGLVNAITMFEDFLFAGMEDGTIMSWKFASNTSFSESTSLKGHTGSVLSLIVGAKKLFSGSTDQTIRVWDLESLKCTHVLKGHGGDVTTVICWDQYLLSGSLDRTIKVWAATEYGYIEEVYKHNVDNGVLAFCGMRDAEEKPILLCSCKDYGVCLYDLPSFVERGRIFSKWDIHAIQISPEGLFFTGDEAGLVSVWKPNGEPVSKSC